MYPLQWYERIIFITILFILIICSFIDVIKKEIPILFIIILWILSVGQGIQTICFYNREINELMLHIGGFLIGVGFMLLSYLTRGAIGYGDSIILGARGTMIGAYQVIVLILFSFIFLIGSLFICYGYLFIRGKHRKYRKVTIPYIPFLTMAYSMFLIIFY